jgi:hypothetical protein
MQGLPGQFPGNTVTVKKLVALSPQESVATTSTVVLILTGKQVVRGGLYVSVTLLQQLSVAVAENVAGNAWQLPQVRMVVFEH